MNEIRGNFNENTITLIYDNAFENVLYIMAAILYPTRSIKNWKRGVKKLGVKVYQS